MPTYQYVCTKCGHEFELFQSMMDKHLSHCPKEHCAQKSWGKGKVKRMIGAGAGLIFKGTGFYITDYRSQNYKDAAKKDSAPATASPGDSKSTSSTTAPSASGPAKPSKPETKPAQPAKT